MSLEKSVFQFFSFAGNIPKEKLKNWKTKKLKNWKTKKLNPYGESLPECPWKIQFFSFLVFQFLRKYFEIVPETKKLKN